MYLNTVRRARFVGIDIVLRGGVIDDLNRLDIHRERCLGVISLAASPVDSALDFARVTSCPDTNSHTHRCLWEASASFRISIVDCPNNGAINRPGQFLLRPNPGVFMEHFLRGRHRLPGPSIVIFTSVTFAEVICLEFVGRTTQCFLYIYQQICFLRDALQVRAHPVNLIIVV